MRHRTQSFNEWSARYSQLQPKFYLPQSDRPLIQKGKPGNYSFEVAEDPKVYDVSMAELLLAYDASWKCYRHLLEDVKIAKEVARMCLPVAVYTSWYATANLRNWLGFLSLRTDEKALYEIRRVAFQIEQELVKLFPITLEEWDRSGRRAI